MDYSYYWWECKVVQSHWKIVWEFLKMLSDILSYISAFPIVEIYSSKLKTRVHTEPGTWMFITVLSLIPKVKTTQTPINWEVIKHNFICSYKGTLFINKIILASTWVNLKYFMLSEKSLMQKNICCVHHVYKMARIYKSVETKVDYCLSGAGNGNKVWVWKREKISFGWWTFYKTGLRLWLHNYKFIKNNCIVHT